MADEISVVEASLRHTDTEIDIDGEDRRCDPAPVLAVPTGPTLLEAEAAYAETAFWQRAPDMPENWPI